jgi:glycogen(starch) synthase
MDDPWSDVEESGRWLLALESEHAPDIIHLNSYGHGALRWRTPVILTAHSCVASWWTAVKAESLPHAWSRYRKEVRRSLVAVQTITAPSRAMLESLGENYGINLSREKCHVIPNGRTAARFRQEVKSPFILAAGRLWDEGKNIAALAEVASELPWPVCLAGEPVAPDGSSVTINGCHMLGQLSSDQLAGYYARAAIYALPARYEPFGLSVLEAALSGCALVLGDIRSLRETWDEAAVFVRPDRPEILGAALRQLIANSEARTKMAQRSYRRAHAFTPDRVASAYMAAYHEALKGSYACAS